MINDSNEESRESRAVARVGGRYKNPGIQPSPLGLFHFCMDVWLFHSQVLLPPPNTTGMTAGIYVSHGPALSPGIVVYTTS